MEDIHWLSMIQQKSKTMYMYDYVTLKAISQHILTFYSIIQPVWIQLYFLSRICLTQPSNFIAKSLEFDNFKYLYLFYLVNV